MRRHAPSSLRAGRLSRVLVLEDAVGDDVLIADRLDGDPLPIEHGGPWRLVSVSQYGYKSVKHLCRIELHTREPSDRHPHFTTGLALSALAPHPRARSGTRSATATCPRDSSAGPTARSLTRSCTR